MGFYGDHVLPRVLNVAMANREYANIRQRVASTLSGEVLEVGFGSGLNVPFYPAQVRRVVAVDPATVGQTLARSRLAASPVRVEFFAGDMSLLADESIDHVLVTWTLCTIVDVEGALAQMYRVVRRGGQLHFVEHGRSPEPGVARWQDRLNPLQRAWAGGCNLNRRIDSLVVAAGFELATLDNFYAQGLRPMEYMYEGVGTKA